MYASVPRYRSGTLHRLSRRDLPPSPRGLLTVWLRIFEIQRRRKEDPAYQYRAALPATAPTGRST
jgi:hypothetical protein